MQQPIDGADDVTAALAVLTAPSDTDSRCCGVCGVPQVHWWTEVQREAHRRYHQAQATIARQVTT